MAKPPVPKTGASRALAVAICWYNFVVVQFGLVFVLFLGLRGGVGRGDVGSRIVVTAGEMLDAVAAVLYLPQSQGRSFPQNLGGFESGPQNEQDRIESIKTNPTL